MSFTWRISIESISRKLKDHQGSNDLVPTNVTFSYFESIAMTSRSVHTLRNATLSQFKASILVPKPSTGTLGIVCDACDVCATIAGVARDGLVHDRPVFGQERVGRRQHSQEGRREDVQRRRVHRNQEV